MGRDRLQRHDAPRTLAILHDLLGQPTDRHELGYKPDQWGAEVDWDLLTTGTLSTTEIATMHIARGCAIAERHGGGLPATAQPAVTAAIQPTPGAPDPTADQPMTPRTRNRSGPPRPARRRDATPVHLVAG